MALCVHQCTACNADGCTVSCAGLFRTCKADCSSREHSNACAATMSLLLRMHRLSGQAHALVCATFNWIKLTTVLLTCHGIACKM